MELVTGQSTQGYDPVDHMPTRCSRRTIAAIFVGVIVIIALSVLLAVNVIPVHTTSTPTSAPTTSPTSEPTTSPTSEPTADPTPAPTPAPTAFSVCSVNSAVAGPTLNNRSTDTACAFADGRVMVTGMYRLANFTYVYPNASAIWSPLTNQWSASAYPSDLLVQLHTLQADLVLLPDTSLLLFGGITGVGSNNASLRFANDSWGTLSPSPAFSTWGSDRQHVVVPAGLVTWFGNRVAYYHLSNFSWTTGNKTGNIEESRACLMTNNTIISVGGYVTGSPIIDYQFYVMPDNSTLEGVWSTMNGSAILSRYAHNIICTPTHGVYVAGGVSVVDDLPMSAVARWFNGAWTTVQPIPAGQSRVYAAMMQSNPSNFVVIGGAYGWSEAAASTPSVLIYTLANDTWSLGPSLAPGRMETPVALVGNRFMVLGGYDYVDAVRTAVNAIDLVCVV